jgi:hypothetical protein
MHPSAAMKTKDQKLWNWTRCPPSEARLWGGLFERSGLGRESFPLWNFASKIPVGLESVRYEQPIVQAKTPMAEPHEEISRTRLNLALLVLQRTSAQAEALGQKQMGTGHEQEKQSLLHEAPLGPRDEREGVNMPSSSFQECEPEPTDLDQSDLVEIDTDFVGDFLSERQCT